MTKSRIFISTITMIAFATVFTGCPMNGNGTGVRQINVTIEEINFRTVGDFTQEEIDAIQAELDTLTVTQLAAFANYVSSVTLAQNDGLVVTVVGTGAGARASITIGSGATAQELVAALEAGRDAARRVQNPEAEFIVDQGGIRFYANSDISNEDRAAFESQVGALDPALLAEVAPYILRFTRVAAGSLVEGAEATRSIELIDQRGIVLSTTADIQYLNVILEQVRQYVRDRLGLDGNGDNGLDPGAINNGLLLNAVGTPFVLTGNPNAPDVQVQVTTHGLTNAQRAAIVAGQDTSHETQGSLQTRFGLLNPTRMSEISNLNITKFVIIENDQIGGSEALAMQFVDFTNRSDDSDGFAAIIPFENDPRVINGRIVGVRNLIQVYNEGDTTAIPTPGVRVIWPISDASNAQARGRNGGGGATVSVTKNRGH